MLGNTTKKLLTIGVALLFAAGWIAFSGAEAEADGSPGGDAVMASPDEREGDAPEGDVREGDAPEGDVREGDREHQGEVRKGDGEHDGAGREGDSEHGGEAREGDGEHGGEGGEGEHGGEGHDEEGEESGVYIERGDTWDEVRRGARLVLAYDAGSDAFHGRVDNTTEGTLCAVRVEVHLGGGPELGPTPRGDLAAGGTMEIVLPAEGQQVNTWTAHPEMSGCQN